MIQQEKTLYVNRAAFQRIVSSVVDDIAQVIEGPLHGENVYTYGLTHQREGLYQVVREAKEQGEMKVPNLLVYDWVSIPLFNASSDEPGWYLTISLNAVVK